jgi:24-methylenesterol C-methyltransferase
VYWFVWVMGVAEVKGKRVVDLKMGSIMRDKVQDKYTQYWSFFRGPKETTTKAAVEKVPTVVDTFYNLVAEGRRWVGLKVAMWQSSDSAPVAPPSPPPHRSARR